VASFLVNRTHMGIALVVTTGNGDIPSLATKDGVAAGVEPFYPGTDISLVAVRNEIVDTGDQS
jgi:hypothetical protein